eukprot:gene13520-18138_t
MDKKSPKKPNAKRMKSTNKVMFTGVSTMCNNFVVTNNGNSSVVPSCNENLNSNILEHNANYLSSPLNWFGSSPFGGLTEGLTTLSPSGSTMTFSLSSPPGLFTSLEIPLSTGLSFGAGDGIIGLTTNREKSSSKNEVPFSSIFSPSLFSPNEMGNTTNSNTIESNTASNKNIDAYMFNNDIDNFYLSNDENSALSNKQGLNEQLPSSTSMEIDNYPNDMVLNRESFGESKSIEVTQPTSLFSKINSINNACKDSSSIIHLSRENIKLDNTTMDNCDNRNYNFKPTEESKSNNSITHNGSSIVTLKRKLTANYMNGNMRENSNNTNNIEDQKVSNKISNSRNNVTNNNSNDKNETNKNQQQKNTITANELFSPPKSGVDKQIIIPSTSTSSHSNFSNNSNESSNNDMQPREVILMDISPVCSQSSNEMNVKNDSYDNISSENHLKEGNYNSSNHFFNRENPSKSIKSNKANSKTSCNCKKSKCLKLYCDCFAVLSFCDPSSCNCNDCFNTNSPEHSSERDSAIRIIKDRNRLAFQSKVTTDNGHSMGCHCNKSHCLKKYCECFNGNAFCAKNCKCNSCQNYSGSVELRKVRGHDVKRDKTIPETITKPRRVTIAHPSKSRNNIVSPEYEDVNDNQDVQIDSKTTPHHSKVEVVSSTITKNERSVRSGNTNDNTKYNIDGTINMNKTDSFLVTPHNKPSSQVLNAQPSQSQVPSDMTMSSNNSSINPIMISSTQQAIGVIGTRGVLRLRKSPPITITPASKSANSNNNNKNNKLNASGSSLLTIEDNSETPYTKNNYQNLTDTSQYSIALNKPKRQCTLNNSFESPKKKKITKIVPSTQAPILYPFFGTDYPPTSKATALSILEYLDGKDIYAMSLVNTLWSDTAFDDALWE